MAKNEKKISISAIDKVLKEDFVPSNTYDWHGIEVRIKKNLSLVEMLEFVHDVVSSCFNAEGGYMPEVQEFVIRTNVVTRYANFSMPSNLEHRYEIVYNTDIYNFVCEHIDLVQCSDIIDAAISKINNLCDSNVADIQRRMDEVVASFEEMEKQSAEVFKYLKPEDITKVAQAIEGGALDEEKIVAAYLDQKNKAVPALEVVE